MTPVDVSLLKSYMICSGPRGEPLILSTASSYHLENYLCIPAGLLDLPSSLRLLPCSWGNALYHLSE